MLQPLPGLFVDRTRELEEFDSVLTSLARGRRRHLALLGLRRIGKTVLLDEVRRRHPDFPTCYVALDDIASSPGNFALNFVGQLLATATTAKNLDAPLERTDDALLVMAATLDQKLVGPVREIRGHVENNNYGGLITAVMRFPDHLSEVLDIPHLVMIDEFQDIVKLMHFPGTGNLLGAFRAALDRRGRVGYVVAGSQVTTLRRLIGDSESPLFTRFVDLPLNPFGLEATTELATALWQQEENRYDPDAVVRLYRLSGGWPFYIYAIAVRAQQIVRASTGMVTDEIIDLAFQEELFGRLTHVGQHCSYLRKTATQSDSDAKTSLLEEVLKQVAARQPLARASLVRRLVRRYSQTEIYVAINRLIDTDFISEENGTITLLDPVFALWLAAEPIRLDPLGNLMKQRAVRKLIEWYEQRHIEDRTTMGGLFEKRVENLVRQFAGQEVDGKYFGVTEQVILPKVRQVRQLKVHDPHGVHGEGPDEYEIDLVTSGVGQEDMWGIECKHRRGAVTSKMVKRFVDSASAVANAEALSFARLWIVTNRGIRGDALTTIRAKGILASGSRDIDQLEHLLSRMR
ncbi:MAG: ATP-binding protein [Chloroflexi bacterium]|nr:ATP-binding protein [Chloroflexota bacterium]